MKTKLGLASLNTSEELNISGGSCPECRIDHSHDMDPDNVTWRDIGAFFHGIFDGYTE